MGGNPVVLGVMELGDWIEAWCGEEGPFLEFPGPPGGGVTLDDRGSFLALALNHWKIHLL